MADSAQDIHQYLGGSTPMSHESISTEQERVSDSPRETNGQPSNLTQLEYLSRICKALELQAEIAQENQKVNEEGQGYYRRLREEQQKRREEEQKRHEEEQKRHEEEGPNAVVRVLLESFGRTEEIENLIINSEPLLKIFQDVAGFYPGVNLNSNPFFIPRPFSFLFHTLPALREHAQEKRNDDEASELLRVKLLPKCDEMFAKLFESFRCAFVAGDVFYLALGALFRPGIVLLAVDALDQRQLFMCMGGKHRDIHSSSRDAPQIGPNSEFGITSWALSWDPFARCINRKIIEFSVPFFEGTRKVEGLPIYPFDIYANEEGQRRVKEELIVRGRRWAQLLSGKPTCWMHEGLCIPLAGGFEEAPYMREDSERTLHTSIHRGRLIVDSSEELPLGSTFIKRSKESQNAKFWDSRHEYVDYDSVSPQKLADDQAIFCPSAVRCTDPRNLQSVAVAITDLNPIQWNKLAFEKLVLDENRKNIIRSLVENHSKEFSQNTKDIIEGKGAGLVIVLYGPPGVGKTLTAESVAEFTKKPLIALRVSNLLTESGFSDTLSKFLDDADRLGAILLLDEADVILEARSFEDIKRNGMVSAFLRMLEYFNGIIFMTTNRLGTMDHAFQSRIQYATEYTALSTVTRRKIWKLFIERQENLDSREELLEDMDYLKKLDLNGRQIRNAMKLALSLALQESSEVSGEMLDHEMKMAPLKKRHVRQAAKEMLSLQQYFNKRKESSQEEIGAGLGDQRKFEVKIRGQYQTPLRDDSDQDE